MRRLAYVDNEEGSIVGVAGYAYYDNIERADPRYTVLYGGLALCTRSGVLSFGWGCAASGKQGELAHSSC